MTQCITNVFLCKSPSWALHRVHNHISTGGPDRKGSQERHSQRRIQLLVHRNYFAVSLIKPVNFGGKSQLHSDKVKAEQSLINDIFGCYLCCILAQLLTAPSDSQADTDSWTLSFTSPKVQSGAVVNPTGLTNWLLSSLRGLNLSDLTDSARAMKRYSAHRLNT